MKLLLKRVVELFKQGSMRDARVSVVVPCFNEEPEIVEQSFSSLSLQTFKDFECIVVDESTDPKKAEACRKLCEKDDRFKYIHPEVRLGLAASLNYGFELALGEYIARFDSDDLCDPKRLEKQVDFLDQNREIGIIGSSMRIIDSSGKLMGTRIYPCNHQKIEQQFVYTNAIAHPTVMLRKEIISREQGPYRIDFRFSEDLELWLRLLNKGVRFANLADVLVSYRQDSTYRPAANWEFNARARRMHMSAPYRIQKAMVAGLLSAWASLPKIFQEYIYTRIVFRRHG